jgi:hypothetical protein
MSDQPTIQPIYRQDIGEGYSHHHEIIGNEVTHILAKKSPTEHSFQTIKRTLTDRELELLLESTEPSTWEIYKQYRAQIVDFTLANPESIKQ